MAHFLKFRRRQTAQGSEREILAGLPDERFRRQGRHEIDQRWPFQRRDGRFILLFLCLLFSFRCVFHDSESSGTASLGRQTAKSAFWNIPSSSIQANNPPVPALSSTDEADIKPLKSSPLSNIIKKLLSCTIWMVSL
jgi:hypothetical protein